MLTYPRAKAIHLEYIYIPVYHIPVLCLSHQYSSYSTGSSVGVWYDECDTMSVIRRVWYDECGTTQECAATLWYKKNFFLNISFLNIFFFLCFCFLFKSDSVCLYTIYSVSDSDSLFSNPKYIHNYISCNQAHLDKAWAWIDYRFMKFERFWLVHTCATVLYESAACFMRMPSSRWADQLRWVEP